MPIRCSKNFLGFCKLVLFSNGRGMEENASLDRSIPMYVLDKRYSWRRSDNMGIHRLQTAGPCFRFVADRTPILGWLFQKWPPEGASDRDVIHHNRVGSTHYCSCHDDGQIQYFHGCAIPGQGIGLSMHFSKSDFFDWLSILMDQAFLGRRDDPDVCRPTGTHTQQAIFWTTLRMAARFLPTDWTSPTH